MTTVLWQNKNNQSTCALTVTSCFVWQCGPGHGHMPQEWRSAPEHGDAPWNVVMHPRIWQCIPECGNMPQYM